MNTAPDFITPIIRRIIESNAEVAQRDFARACSRHESWVCQLKAGKAHLTAADLVVFCDHYDTHEPFDAMADRLNLEIQEKQRASSSTGSLRRHVAQLMADIGRVAIELEDALDDGTLSPAEIGVLTTQLQSVVESARAAKARLPKARGVR
jgi:hypothetical protein